MCYLDQSPLGPHLFLSVKKGPQTKKCENCWSSPIFQPYPCATWTNTPSTRSVVSYITCPRRWDLPSNTIPNKQQQTILSILRSRAPPGPSSLLGQTLWARPPQTSSSSAGLLGGLKNQLVQQTELGAAVGGTTHLPLTGRDAHVVGDAGGLLQDLHAPWGDTGAA